MSYGLDPFVGSVTSSKPTCGNAADISMVSDGVGEQHDAANGLERAYVGYSKAHWPERKGRESHRDSTYDQRADDPLSVHRTSASPACMLPPPWSSAWRQDEPEALRNNLLPDFGPVRGRTLQRAEPSTYTHRPSPGSRASSASSVRSMIDECLERAHNDRLQSQSRERSAPPSPFQEHSPFYEEYARTAGLSYQSSNNPILFKDSANIAPIYNRRFQHHKTCSCDYCAGDSRHTDELETCGYCNDVFPSFINGQMHPDHLAYFQKCNDKLEAKKSFWMDHFRQCSRDRPRSSDSSGNHLGNRFEKACEQQSSPSKHAMAIDRVISQTSSTPMSTTQSISEPPVEQPNSTKGPPQMVLDFLRRWEEIYQNLTTTTNKRSSASEENTRNSRPPQKRKLSLSRMDSIHWSASRNGSIFLKDASSKALPLASANSHAMRTSRRACIRCRRKKLRCDGGSPGGRCIVSEIAGACRYPERNPPTESAGNDGSIPQVAPLQDSGPTELARSSSAPELPAEATDPPLRFKCDACERTFSRRTVLIIHQRSHTGEKPFACGVSGCGQTFAQQGDKTRHEQAQHSEKTFFCGGTNAAGHSWGCGKAFRRKDGLLEHHQKTAKGRQCIADRDEILAPGISGDGSTSTHV